ncbi:MAG TPA: YMGG-like glycine zipper-containing protein [Pyrinomonadaceae bacterium]|nr:YMGG-like glycine zipper-containing protein [Pyrinomonadaceae bacterium]
MKKFFAIIIMLTLLSAASLTSFAQGRESRRYRTYNSRSYYDYRNRDRSFWDQHRDKLTVVGGAGAGALLGSIFGGKKGALIGAAAGAGGGALYTYKLRDRNRYRRY